MGPTSQPQVVVDSVSSIAWLKGLGVPLKALLRVI